MIKRTIDVSKANYLSLKINSYLGEVRVLKITDKQFGRIEIFFGKLSQPVESPPEQLEFF